MAGAEAPDFDLLVVGGGMAGMLAACRAAEAGAAVLVVERAPDIGGTAAVSGGYVWTLDSLVDFRRIAPLGEPILQQMVLDRFPDVVAWLRETDLVVRGPVALFGGSGYLVDIAGLLARCHRSVAAAGGEVLRKASVHRLVKNGRGVVAGVEVEDASGRGIVTAPWTILATGGFQGDSELMAQHVASWAAHAPVRANRWSDGGGLRLATGAGAGEPVGATSFYGHLIPAAVPFDDPRRFRSLGLYHSERGVLLGKDGRRFTDESRGDHVSAQASYFHHEREALLVWDAHVQRDVVIEQWPPGSPGEDRYAIARAAGARAATATSLIAVVEEAAMWGFDRAAVLDEVGAFNDGVRGRAPLVGPGRDENRRALDEPPFYAVVVESAVTFPYRGLRVDRHARVLDGSGGPIAGLLAAGVDIGGVMGDGYAGGLALAATSAFEAARTVQGLLS